MSVYYSCIINGISLKIKLTEEGISILNSYIIKDDADKKETIDELCFIFPQILEHRTKKDIFYEWKAHNILFNKNIQKKRTRDTDLEFNLKTFHRIVYRLICLIFKEK